MMRPSFRDIETQLIMIAMLFVVVVTAYGLARYDDSQIEPPTHLIRGTLR